MKRITLLLLIAALLAISVGNASAGPTRPTHPTASLHVQDGTPAGNQADAWRQSRPADAASLDWLAAQPTGVWLGEWSGDVAAAAARAMSPGGHTAVLVVYGIPHRDCGSYSGGGMSAAQYPGWIEDIARGIGSHPAVVVLEPDAIALADCLSDELRNERYRLLSGAVTTLSANPATEVYIDAGHSNWHAASVTASRLRHAGVAHARGFALNTSNFQRTEAEVTYGRAVSAALGARTPFVIDTSRNGNGPISAADGWCNPPGRAVGRTPTTDTQTDLVDAFLWVKVPGESDGSCRGGPSAGVFWPEYAVGLAGSRRPLADSPFQDVFEADTHAASIVRLSRLGVLSGVTSTRFAPGAPVTRGQFASFSVRTLNHHDDATPLPDTHDEALTRLLAMGVVRGDSNGDLRSGEPITREQAASMLVRLIDANRSAPLPQGHHRFRDVSGTHADAVNRLAASGIVSGRTDGTFSPRSTLTRAQAATLLVRTLDLLDVVDATRHPSTPAEGVAHADRRTQVANRIHVG
ncbi:MAG: glycoside hydrolase family 6 protein [Nitriliruptoraceae bacterium]